MTYRKLLIAAAFAAFAIPASAQEWPTRPLTMVVPFAAGGPIDTLGRVLQQPLSEALGQQIIIENVPGGGGMTGSMRVANAEVDSHTFVLGSIGTHSIGQSMHKKPLYDAATAFQPVILVADAPLVLIVRKDLPAKDFKEFAAYTKANQAKMQFGSGGTGTSSHIGCVLLNQTIGATVVHVPYRGGGPALQDLIAGRIDYICNYVSTAVPAVASGQARVLATLAGERSTAFPDVPTADQQVRKIEMSGHVLFVQKDQQGSGDSAVYDKTNEMMTMYWFLLFLLLALVLVLCYLRCMSTDSISSALAHM